MFDEDFQSPKKSRAPRNLEPLSVDELRDYIAALQEEIARTEAEIARKKAHADKAASFFKNGG